MRVRFLPLALVLLTACSAAREGDLDGPPLPRPDGGAVANPDVGGFGTEAGFDPAPDGGGSTTPGDFDGDGFEAKDDCNDANPEVNPGAYEVPGDGVDNDCNGKVDEVDDCDEVTDPNLYKSMNAMDFAKALGLCRTATKGATGKDRTWGVLGAELVSADGSPLKSAQSVQHAVLDKFGTLLPRAGKHMVVLSSGTARTPGQPDFVKPRSISGSFRVSDAEVTPPAGHPQNSGGCPEPTKKTANDSVNLKLSIRVPTNANSFQFDFDFFSSEYSTFLCTDYNDTFVAILDGKSTLDPKNAKNISFDGKGGPVNVNSGFFEVCTPGTYKGKSYPCAKGTSELEGTGFWEPDVAWQNGATSWLRTKAPVVPGEEITIQFMIWDTGDHALDSTVLVDAWRWDAKPTTAPTTDRPK